MGKRRWKCPIIVCLMSNVKVAMGLSVPLNMTDKIM